MNPVVGTAIERSCDDERPRSLLVSDLHVSREAGAVADAFEAVCASAREKADTTRLLILGDLFEFYIHPGQLEHGGWQRVADAIRQTVDAGVPVTILHGNRDFLLDRRFERRTGARVVAGGLRCELAGRSTLLLHGDELCLNDVPYQRAKRWLRHPVTRWVAYCLPLGMALGAGRQMRQKSADSAEPVYKHERYAPVVRAVEEALGEVDQLVFGHIHQPARGSLGGKEYLVLPAFDETGVLLEADETGVRYCKVGGEPVADYPPARFAD